MSSRAEELRAEYNVFRIKLDKIMERDGSISPAAIDSSMGVAQYSALMEIAIQLALLNEQLEKK